MATFISYSPEETADLGEQWGRAASAGWVIGLSGELGSGKTQWVKGFARGLGIADVVRSPTFALLHEYGTGRIPLVHLDFYRLESSAEIVRAGLEEYLDAPRGVTVVEWIERWLETVPPSRSGLSGGEFRVPSWLKHLRRLQFESFGETERRITYEDPGA